MDGQSLQNDKDRMNHILEEYPLRLAESYVRAGNSIDEAQPFCTLNVSKNGVQIEQAGSKANLDITSKWSQLPGSPNSGEVLARIHGKGQDSFIIEDLFGTPLLEKKGDPLVSAVETDSHGPGQPFTIRKTIVDANNDHLGLPLVDIYNRANPDAKPEFIGQTQEIAAPQANARAQSIRDANGHEIAQIYEVVEPNLQTPGTIGSVRVYIRKPTGA